MRSKQVNSLIEASAEAAMQGDAVQALERAKAAGKKERQLCKHRESNGLVDQINMDLTYSVCFNLANAVRLFFFFFGCCCCCAYGLLTFFFSLLLLLFSTSTT